MTVVNRLDDIVCPAADQPWITELMWFLQAGDKHGDACEQLARDLIKRFPENLVTASVRKRASAKLSRGEGEKLWSFVPLTDQTRFNRVVPSAWIELDEIFSDNNERQAAERRKGFPELDAEGFCDLVELAAIDRIAECLRDIVFGKTGFPTLDCWAFRDLQGAIKLYFEKHAADAKKRIALTAVTEKVFDALNFAWEEGVMVQIVGDPRHGKTESIATYCAMYPGRARLVTVPSESTDADFFRAVAKALHIDIDGPSFNVRAVRERIDYVLEKARLLLIFDEFHFAIPQRYSETTAPVRMNWIRTRVADRGLPAALLITPQSFDSAFDKFAKKTQHRFDQFFGRTACFTLPSTLPSSEVIAVAQIHFPEIDLDYLGLMAGRAMQCQPGKEPSGRLQPGFLHGIKVTAHYARFLARKAGRVMNEDDVIEAMNQMMPLPNAPQKPCKEPEAVLQTPPRRRSGSVALRDSKPISRTGHNDSPSRLNAEELAA